jgi:hypothetical protein
MQGFLVKSIPKILSHTTISCGIYLIVVPNTNREKGKLDCCQPPKNSFSTPSRQDAETQSEPRKTRLSRRIAALELREGGGFT